MKTNIANLSRPAIPAAEFFTLSLHDALPILTCTCAAPERIPEAESRVYLAVLPQKKSCRAGRDTLTALREDRKSTRLNSSHLVISYSVFCLNKKNRELHSTYN